MRAARPSPARALTVGIVDAYAAPTIEADADTYATRHGDAAFAAGQLTQSAPKKLHPRQDECDPSGWYGEETLDVEAVHAMAPGANVRFYGAKSCEDPDIADTLDARRGREPGLDRLQLLRRARVRRGARATSSPTSRRSTRARCRASTFFFSSGDNGDEQAATGTSRPTTRRRIPYITSVGGTSTAIAATARWRSRPAGARRSTRSRPTARPGRRRASCTAPAAATRTCSTGRPTRTRSSRPALPRAAPYPDVALDADPTTGMLVGETQSSRPGPPTGSTGSAAPASPRR